MKGVACFSEKDYNDYWEEVARTRCWCGLSLGLHFDDCPYEGQTLNNGEPEKGD
jgi:hypothetical protein